MVGEATFALPLAGVIDHRRRTGPPRQGIAKHDDEIGKIDKKLGNEQFVAKAPEEVIEEQRTRRAGGRRAPRQSWLDALERLKVAAVRTRERPFSAVFATADSNPDRAAPAINHLLTPGATMSP